MPSAMVALGSPLPIILCCDAAGTIYVFGSSKHNGSTVMLDATADPMDPTYLGATDDWYVHHGFARNDTLYESNIYEGLVLCLGCIR